MDLYRYIELTFCRDKMAIIKKISWSDWYKEVDDKRLLMTSNERILFLYDVDDIKFYWKKFRHKEKDSYDPPFSFSKLRIAI